MSKKENAVNSFVDILGLIKTGIAETANSKAIDLLVNKRIEAEIGKRADLLEKGLDAWAKLKKELDNCRPDVVNHVMVGEDKSEFGKEEKYSDAKFKELGALKDKLVKLEAALLLAQGEKQDYEKLANAVK